MNNKEDKVTDFDVLMDFINKLSKEQIQKVSDELNKKLGENSKTFEPEENDDYWYIDEDGDVLDTTFLDHDNSCRWDVLSGNCFRTEEEAEFAKQKRLVEVELQRFADENNEEIDWYDLESLKYYLFFDIEFKSVKAGAAHKMKRNDVYFSSRELAEQAVAQIGYGRIKKYIFGGRINYAKNLYNYKR